MQTLKKIIPFLFIVFITSQSSAETYNDQKVIYHINYDNPQRISATFTNIANHINQLGEESVTIKAVIHGPAIQYFIDAAHDNEKQIALDALRLSDVQFVICRNSLEGFNVSYTDLYDVDEADVVQAGLPEIVHLQQQGFFYVRP